MLSLCFSKEAKHKWIKLVTQIFFNAEGCKSIHLQTDQPGFFYCFVFPLSPVHIWFHFVTLCMTSSCRWAEKAEGFFVSVLPWGKGVGLGEEKQILTIEACNEVAQWNKCIASIPRNRWESVPEFSVFSAYDFLFINHHTWLTWNQQ